MPIILSKDTLTLEPTVVVQSKKGIVHFRGTEVGLIQMIKDCHNMAEFIAMDLDAGNISEENEGIAVDKYQEFAKKYH